MVVHVITLIIGIFSCIISSWLINSICESIGRGNKADKFMVFWSIYSAAVGIFLIITG